MKCAAYARFSSDRQKPASIDDQLRRCRRFADDNKLVWLPQHVYVDEAVSGMTAERAGLSALLAAVSANGARPFDCILVDDTSRISRNLADALRFYEYCSFAGVRVVAVSQGVDSISKQAKLIMGVHGLIDEEYSRELAEKTHRGMEGVALRGLATGGRCFGFRTNDSAGEKKLEVFEPEAAVVRRIFAMSAEEVSVKKIARTLNADGVPSPQPYRGQRHASWAASAVSVMLRNERYAGRQVWNRTRKLPHPETNRRIQRRRPPHEWVVTQAEHLRIVSDKLFEAVQARLQRMRAVCGGIGGGLGCGSAAGVSGRAAGYLLSGLLRCELCGSRMVIVAGKGRGAASQKYGCPLRERGVCENALVVQRAVLEEEVLAGIERRVLSPDSVSKYVRWFEHMVRQQARQSRSASQASATRRDELRRNAARLARLIAEDERSEHLVGELRRIEAELTEIGTPAASQSGFRPGCGEWLITRLAEVRSRLRADAEKAKAVLSASIRDGIRIVPEALGYRITVAWELFGATLSGAGGQNRTAYAGLFRAALYR